MILSNIDLRHNIAQGNIGISPFDERCVRPASIDLRLHTELQSTSNRSILTIGEDGFRLWPGQFLLACSIETVRLPRELCAMLTGRSSHARKGLQVHMTAGFFDPGFTGQAVFELNNISQEPFILMPGMRIAQLVFMQLLTPARPMYGEETDSGKYQHQRGAQESLASRDYELNPTKSMAATFPARDWEYGAMCGYRIGLKECNNDYHIGGGGAY